MKICETSLFFRYKTEFGFTLQDRDVVVDDVRVRGIGRSSATDSVQVEKASGPPVKEKVCFLHRFLYQLFGV